MKRPGDLPDDFEVAVHESAHGVVSCALGAPFKFITITPSEDGTMRGWLQRTPEQFKALADESLLISLAAPGYAEHYILGWDSHAIVGEHMAGDDLALWVHGRELLWRQRGGLAVARCPSEGEVFAFLGQFRQQAQVLVVQHLPWIRNTAHALCLRRTLTYDEVDACRRVLRPVMKRSA